ncbi:hypothetical protein VTL71DRAFT_2511 [Oculimacula yallundae]|uniref:Uncharacterized protein n=1 Tax=Oculimacula yallundae TaxID=86028 RepID=A0ABR4C958_9HELO
MNNDAQPSTSVLHSEATFLDPSLSSLRAFRTRAYFWDQYTTDAMAFRDEKFKAYNCSAETIAASAPKIEAHYEDHFASASRQPRFPRLNVITPATIQPQLQPQQISAVQLRIWCLSLMKLMFMVWMLGQLGIWDLGLWNLGFEELRSGVMLVVMGAVSIGAIGCALVWLEMEVEGETE